MVSLYILPAKRFRLIGAAFGRNIGTVDGVHYRGVLFYFRLPDKLVVNPSTPDNRRAISLGRLIPKRKTRRYEKRHSLDKTFLIGKIKKLPSREENWG